ncbi:MAG: hypothetical protein EZS26_000693 [Candidatus Ordinivivax streblomastigis]|uniref:GLUG domain-containing protein n=1 Tax=Candidatus Ordinivivax streblomastigis TaxID=2540710 RepID=A0A5M8P4C9_9BACT|nr:MAG: hypothetical protein EZS26_000693 [Candidatus Ordinivivax streblomastigis]
MKHLFSFSSCQSRKCALFPAKKIQWICSALLALLVVVSCKDDETEQPKVNPYIPADPTEVVLNATITTAENRNLMTGLHWTDNDSIGLFVKLNGDYISGGYLLKAGTLSNEGKTGIFTGSVHWEKKSLQHNFYAYYPKTTEVNDAARVPVSLPAVQNQNGITDTYRDAYNVLVAYSKVVTAPKDITKPELNKPVEMDFISAYSALEFRFASYKETGLTISKITIHSDNRDFTVQNGFLDLTKGDFETDYAKIYGGIRSDSVVLNIANPTEVPVSTRKTVILGNDGSKPADPKLVFPAYFLVLPNINVPMKDESKLDERWTVTLETNKGPFTRVFTRREMSPGQKYVIEYVVLTTDDGSGAVNPGDDDPGAPWAGAIVQPEEIDNANKTIAIYEPGQLAWVAKMVNEKSYTELNSLGVDSFFREYTVVLEQNINLGAHEWTPIGNASTYKDCFQGTLDGKGYFISNLTIKSAHDVGNYAYVGLFGYCGAKAIKNVNVKNANIGPINMADFGMSYVGGIAAYAPGYHATVFSKCSFEGSITSSTGIHTYPTGGIVGKAESGSITECVSSAKINGTSATKYSALADMGGIAGSIAGCRIKACRFDGELKGTGNWNAGGIVGYASGGSVIACKNEGSIFSDGAQAQLGGIVGDCRCDIVACYNTGAISAPGAASAYDSKGVGGIVGTQYTGSKVLDAKGNLLKACYSTGKITVARGYNSYAGNIIGQYNSFVSSLGVVCNEVINNYYLQSTMTGDTPPDSQPGRVTKFSSTAWPSSSMVGWGIGDGSGDNKYWNKDFPLSPGMIFPTLYWEYIE